MRTGTQRTTLLAGSPLRIFRLTTAGRDLVDSIERGDDIESHLADRLADAGAIHPAPAAPTCFRAADLSIVTPQLGGAVRRDGRITVDDASTPPLDGATVRLETNRGPAAARNEGPPTCHVAADRLRRRRRRPRLRCCRSACLGGVGGPADRTLRRSEGGVGRSSSARRRRIVAGPRSRAGTDQSRDARELRAGRDDPRSRCSIRRRRRLRRADALR